MYGGRHIDTKILVDEVMGIVTHFIALAFISLAGGLRTTVDLLESAMLVELKNGWQMDHNTAFLCSQLLISMT